MRTDPYSAAAADPFGTSVTNRVRRTELWSTPPRALTFILTVEAVVGPSCSSQGFTLISMPPTQPAPD